MSRFLVTFLFITVYTGFQVSLEASQNNPKTPIDSVYYLKAREFFGTGDLDSAKYFLEKSLKETKLSNNLKLEIASTRGLGLVNRILGNFEISINYYSEAETISLENNVVNFLPEIYNDKGIYYDRLGKYDSALSNYFKSLDYSKQLNKTEDISYALNNIGTVYSALGDLEAAIDVYLQSLDIKLSNKISDNLINSYTNIGSTYIDLERPSDGLIYLKDAETICDTLSCSPREKITIFNHLGFAYLMLNKLDSSKYYLDSAMYHAKKESEYEKLVITLRQKALLEKRVGNSYLAIELLDRSAQLSSEYSLLESRRNAYEELSILYDEIGDYENAFKYQQLYNQLKDSLFNEEVASSMRDIVVDFETKEARKTISAQDQEIRLRRQINFLLGLSILLTIAIIIRFFLDLNRRKAMNRRLDREVERKTRELQDTLNLLQQSKNDLDNLIYNISHEIRGPLATLMGLIKVGKMEYGEEDKVHLYLDKLDETAESLNSILKRMIIINSINHYDTVIKDVNIESTIKGVLDTKIDIENTGLTVRADYDGIKSIPTDKGLLETALENIIQNSVRYSDKKENTKVLDIKVRPNDTEGVDIILSDNGIGFDSKYKNHVMDLFFVANEEAGEGIGLHHAKLAVQKLKGEIEIASTRKPTTFIIHLPDSSKKS